MEVLWHWDVSLFQAVNTGWHQIWLDPIFRFISKAGAEAQAVILILLLFYRPTRAVSALCSASYLLSGGVGIILKLSIARERPSNFVFARVLEDVHGLTSFPSGHSTTSFAIATAVSLFFRDTRATVIAFCYAILVGLSRIYVGVHFPTDVLGGAILGSLGAVICYQVAYQRGWFPHHKPESGNRLLPGDQS